MNPLLFADWGRINRLFTRIMWGFVLVLICVMFVAVTQARSGTHAAPAPAIRSAHIGSAHISSAHIGPATVTRRAPRH